MVAVQSNRVLGVSGALLIAFLITACNSNPADTTDSGAERSEPRETAAATVSQPSDEQKLEALRRVADNCIVKQSAASRDAACMDVYEPVCGCNGETYSNGCYASLAGVPKYTRGACEESAIE